MCVWVYVCMCVCMYVCMYVCVCVCVCYRPYCCMWSVGYDIHLINTLGNCLDLQVRRKVEETIKRVFRDIPNIRVAVFAHGDYEDKNDTYDTTWIDFTTDEDKLCEFVRNVSSTCGYDFEECYELVLRQVSHRNIYVTANTYYFYIIFYLFFS